MNINNKSILNIKKFVQFVNENLNQNIKANFKKWFGNSKMIDDNGTPIICYHGTNNEFKEFRSDKGHTHDRGYYGYGYYFTFGNGKYSEDEAKSYGRNIIKVYLKIENIFDFSEMLVYREKEINIMGLQSMVFLYNIALNFPKISNEIVVDNGVPISLIPKFVEKYKKLLKYTEGTDNRGVKYKSGYVKSKLVEYDNTPYGGKKGSYMDYEELGRWQDRISDEALEIGLIMAAIEKYEGISTSYHPEGYMTRNPIITESIKEQGYDGIVQSMYGDEVVVFNSNQIKSIENDGTWDSDDNNIYS